MSFRPESENYKYWTKEEDEKITELVAKATPLEIISKELKRSYSSCASRCSILKIKNRYLGPTLYTKNENFWSEFNPINCYYSGLIAADGNLKLNNKNFKYVGTLSWELHSSDVCLLEDFKKRTEYTGPLHYSASRNHHKICINSDQWNCDLINKFNIVPKKTYRILPPNTNDEGLLFCWLIGYIDGDGMISFNKINKSLCIKIASCSEKIINFIHNFLLTRFTQKFRNKKFMEPRKLKGTNCWEVSINGIRALCLYDYLRQYNLPKLERKWNQQSINDLLNLKKEKFSHFFDYSNLPTPV